MDSAIGFPSAYPLDSNLSSGERYPTFEQPGPDVFSSCWFNLAQFLRQV